MLCWSMLRFNWTGVPSRWQRPQTKGMFRGSDGGALVLDRKNVVIAVAVDAVRRECVAAGDGLAVQRVGVLLLLIGVAGAALHASTPGSWGRSLPSRSAWQLVQESEPWIDPANFLASTKSETVRCPASRSWSCRHGRPGSRRWRGQRRERLANRTQTATALPTGALQPGGEAMLTSGTASSPSWRELNDPLSSRRKTDGAVRGSTRGRDSGHNVDGQGESGDEEGIRGAEWSDAGGRGRGRPQAVDGTPVTRRRT